MMNLKFIIVPMEANRIPPKMLRTDPICVSSMRANNRPEKNAPISNDNPKAILVTIDESKAHAIFNSSKSEDFKITPLERTCDVLSDTSDKTRSVTITMVRITARPIAEVSAA
mmetsp:Transcript_29664/g.47375  ORF Transcript_29664/g.47375 Transcript_29664/m.47375 type:complete len:113 (-) Transcript_29664:325-663(-)